MAVNFGLLQPVDIGGAFEAGFQNARVRGALGALAGDPANPRAQAALAQYHPEMAMRYQDRGRQETFRQGALSAYDPATGNVDPQAMRSAFVGAGDVEGAMRFDQSQIATQNAQQEQARAQLMDMARLLDDATDETSYQQGLNVARQMGIDVSSAPPNFDPAWVAQQRQIVREFVERPEQMTSFMREAAAAGIEPGSPDFRRLLENRYAAPPRIVTGPNGELMIVGGGGGGGQAPPELTDEQIRAMEGQGGAGQPGPQTFPGR